MQQTKPDSSVKYTNIAEIAYGMSVLVSAEWFVKLMPTGVSRCLIEKPTWDGR
jgi:hypothetical protein